MICCDGRVPRPLRVLLAALLAAVVVGCATVAGVVVGGPAVAAPAGTCKPQTVQESTRAAPVIFVGVVQKVVREDRTDGKPGFVFDNTVEVSTVYRGTVDATGVMVQTDKTPRVCGLGRLVRDSAYVFFVSREGDLYVAQGGEGTALATDARVARVEELLGGGKPPVAPEKEEAAFTSASSGEPESFTRAAAPGAALVIVGLLGLVLLRGRGRRA